jgi:hypothetical protein
MASDTGNKPPGQSNTRSDLLQVILAIALAIAAQSAMRNGFLWLGLAGLVIAALLFITSVGTIFRASTGADPMPLVQEPEPVEAHVEPAALLGGADKLRYLRHHWRLVTIAEIFSGDIPPARVGIPEAREAGDETNRLPVINLGDEESRGGSEKG